MMKERPCWGSTEISKSQSSHRKPTTSIVSCHFRYFLLSQFYCHQMILWPEEVPKMSQSIKCPDRSSELESTMISEEHNLQNSRLLSNFTAPGPSAPNLIWSKIIWEIGPTVMSYCFMIPIWSHVWVLRRQLLAFSLVKDLAKQLLIDKSTSRTSS